MNRRDALSFVNDLIIRAALEDAEMEHIVLIVDPENGYVTASGPYDDGAHAIVAADILARDLNRDNGPDDPPYKTIAITMGSPVDITKFRPDV